MRTNLLHAGHETVSDCFYNIAVIYFRLNKFFKAAQHLERVLKVRRKAVGGRSLPVAEVSLRWVIRDDVFIKALELLGRVYLEISAKRDLARACLEECHQIRRRIFQNKDNPALLRVFGILKEIERLTQAEIEE